MARVDRLSTWPVDGGALFHEARAVRLCAAFILSSYRVEARAIISGLLMVMKPASV
jgi:hypothetical protein